jgi:tetratricopeptide (TPR) repeat protein
MASLIPGYEYDIFISYRQKDNKYDGWVTDFVDHLRKEIEATCKDDLSLYFDVNPHDGLTEIHDVDASLQGKLKCLVFIPVISRTFCDPRSFAWDHEFRAFVEQAKGDPLGLKVKLADGNVASRVLPVIIHELNQEDIKRCETLLSGVLRGIEFIYKAAGVNRPLRANEDHPHDNLSKIYYRDQINKVANGIDEIITGLRNAALEQAEEPELKVTADVQVKSSEKSFAKPREQQEPASHSKPEVGSAGKTKVIAYSSTVVIMALLALFIFTSGSTLPFSKRDWIVITDFENLTGDQIFDNSLYTAFTISTSQSRYVNIFPRSRIYETLARMEISDLDYIDEETGREIADREGIAVYIVPGISAAGKRYAISARIMETSTGNLLKSEVLYADNQDEILPVMDDLSRKVRRILGESRFDIAMQDRKLAEVTTSSLEALKVFSLGIEKHIKMDFKGARDSYKEALRIDTGFTAAKASLGNILIERFDPEEGKKYLDEAIKTVGNLTKREQLGILAFHAFNSEKNYPKGIEYSRARLDLYPDDAAAHNNLGWYYQNSNMYSEALEEYKQAVSIDKNLALTYGGIVWIYLDMTGQPDSALRWAGKMVEDNPGNAWSYMNLGSSWFCFDSLEKAAVNFEKAKEISPDLIINLYRLAHTYRKQGRHEEAIAVLKEVLEEDENETSAWYDMGVNYQAMGRKDDARKSFQTFKKSATGPWVDKWPDYSGTYTAIGAVAARLGEMDLSEEMLNKAMKLDSTMHEKFAEVLSLQGKIPEAIAEIEKALKEGYRDYFRLKITPDLEPLNYDIRFRNLLNEYFR